MLLVKIAVLSGLVTIAIWKIRARKNWQRTRSYRIAEAAGRLRLSER